MSLVTSRITIDVCKLLVLALLAFSNNQVKIFLIVSMKYLIVFAAEISYVKSWQLIQLYYAKFCNCMNICVYLHVHITSYIAMHCIMYTRPLNDLCGK